MAAAEHQHVRFGHQAAGDPVAGGAVRHGDRAEQATAADVGDDLGVAGAEVLDAIAATDLVLSEDDLAALVAD